MTSDAGCFFPEFGMTGLKFLPVPCMLSQRASMNNPTLVGILLVIALGMLGLYLLRRRGRRNLNK